METVPGVAEKVVQCHETKAVSRKKERTGFELFLLWSLSYHIPAATAVWYISGDSATQ